LRTYDNADKTAGDFGVGWSLGLANFRVDTNGPLGNGPWSTFTCGSFPFLATCYSPSTPHFVTVTWPDGRLERFRFAPNQGSSLVPTLTTAGFVAEPGTTSTLEALDDGLLLSGGDFLLGNFFFADGIYDPLQFVLTDKTGTKYTLDRRSGLLGIVDRNGNTVGIGSDRIDWSSGLSMTFTRDASNRITRITAPSGNIDYGYSAAGDLVGVSYPNGTTQSFTYDGGHNLVTVSGGGQLVRTLHYDASGRVTSVTDANGATSTIDSNVAGHQQVSTDATGRLTTVSTFDDRGDLIRQDQTFGGRTITTSATFDPFGRQLSATDALGHTSRKSYDSSGNELTETDGNGHTTTFTYNTFGQLLTTTDPTGRVTTNTYDANGYLTRVVVPGSSTTTYAYDANGLMTSMTDAAGHPTTYTNDAAGRPTSATDSMGRTVRQVVDTGTGFVMSITDANGAKTSFAYDPSGFVTGITDANGHSDVHLRRFRRLTATRTRLEPPSRLRPRGNLVSLTDRNGQVTAYEYDADNRLTSKTVSGSGTDTYSRSAIG
jgi:YD repeat-containing protein